jgi:hypothetical protein
MMPTTIILKDRRPGKLVPRWALRRRTRGPYETWQTNSCSPHSPHILATSRGHGNPLWWVIEGGNKSRAMLVENGWPWPAWAKHVDAVRRPYLRNFRAWTRPRIEREIPRRRCDGVPAARHGARVGLPVNALSGNCLVIFRGTVNQPRGHGVRTPCTCTCTCLMSFCFMYGNYGVSLVGVWS